MPVEVFGADEQQDHEIALGDFVALASSALTSEGVRGSAEVSLLFVDEGTIAELNERFMHKTGPTDVLSFPIEDDDPTAGRFPDSGTTGPTMGDEEPEAPTLLGDIVICPKIAAGNAVEHEVSFEAEVALLVVHGVLHLLGWDHQVDADAERMETRERHLLEMFWTGARS